MTAILAIDSSCDLCSVALNLDGEIITRCSSSARRHADEILSMVSSLSLEAQIAIKDLDAIALIQGPGSFTGLRIGSAVAQGFAWPHDIPVVPLSSLAVMALSAHIEHGLTHMHVALNAREDEVYWGSYTAHNMTVSLQGTEQVLNVRTAQLPELDGFRWAGVGNAWSSSGVLAQRMIDTGLYFANIQSRASVASLLGRQILLAGKAGSVKDALPVYLKEQEYR